MASAETDGDPLTAACDSDAILRIDRVGKVFRDDRRERSVEALADVSLEVAAGEIVCLLGPSGCGKSTLLHIAGGFESPTSGTVTAGGSLVTGPGRDRGVVFQAATLFPWKSVAKNVAWPLEVAGSSARDARSRAEELLTMVGLGDFLDAYPAELSGGMKQRAAIARTLAMDPQIMLMDEPFGALDALTRELMQEELLRIRDLTNLTVLFVTHDISEAIRLGDRVAVMSRRPGRIVTVDTIERDPGLSPEETAALNSAYHQRYWGMLRGDQGDAESGN